MPVEQQDISGEAVFAKLITLIAAKNPLQAKALRAYLADRDELFHERAGWFAQGLASLLAAKSLNLEYVAEAYIKMCQDMLREQVRFKRTGQYRCLGASAAYAEVYTSEAEMASYMYGLALSQFLWPNHYEILSFFLRASRSMTGVGRYLEIGPGHGLFLANALEMFPAAESTAVDISPVSLGLCRELVACLAPGRTCAYVEADATRHQFHDRYDYIVMGEVLEHVDEPLRLLQVMRRLLAENGRLFITTCANCPAIDHVYLYDSVAQIRNQVAEAGLAVVEDLPLAVGDFPETEWEAKRVEINYAALLRRSQA